jgi:hypothetical protein
MKPYAYKRSQPALAHGWLLEGEAPAEPKKQKTLSPSRGEVKGEGAASLEGEPLGEPID